MASTVSPPQQIPFPPDPPVQFNDRYTVWLELLIGDGLSLAALCDSNGKMPSNTWTSMKNFLRKAEECGYVVNWPEGHFLFKDTTLRSTSFDPDFGLALKAIRAWTRSQKRQARSGYVRWLAQKLRKELNDAEFESAVGILRFGYYEDDPELKGLIAGMKGMSFIPPPLPEVGPA